ncbi:MAG: hypothetical protein KA116_03845 [Proteobacteria bacterium]|nr:hypothetical protein [Pseudomonadota bacterium]
MKITKKISIKELAALVCQNLKNADIDAFLSGGAVVSIYTNNKYESYDLDFVSFSDRKKIKSVMESLGFSQKKTRHFVHPETLYFVEFPGSSMMVGDQKIIDFDEIKSHGNVLKLLTPTDCIKDRLAAYIHWNDLQSLEQAALVAKNQGVKIRAVQEFCKLEGSIKAFDDFKKYLSKMKK